MLMLQMEMEMEVLRVDLVLCLNGLSCPFLHLYIAES